MFPLQRGSVCLKWFVSVDKKTAVREASTYTSNKQEKAASSEPRATKNTNRNTNRFLLEARSPKLTAAFKSES